MARYLASENVTFFHPNDVPPPLGTKLLLYMYPWGQIIIGEWQNSGASLWAPLLKVPAEMKDRLAKELEQKNKEKSRGCSR